MKHRLAWFLLGMVVFSGIAADVAITYNAPPPNGNTGQFLNGAYQWATPAGGGGGATNLTPWTSDINGAGYSLTNARIAVVDNQISITSAADSTGSNLGFKLFNSGNQIFVYAGGSDVAAFTSSGLGLKTSLGLGGSWNPNTFLISDAANTLALRNGANAQTLRIYGAYTDGANYSRTKLQNDGSYFRIASEFAGTGLAVPILLGGSLQAGGAAPVANWSILSTGHLLAGTDNTYDIGASGANRPRNLYLAGGIASAGIAVVNDVQIGSAGSVFWGNRSILQSPSDGVITIWNYARNDFSRLQFGGTTASFPSIKRNGTALNFRLADDSADADISANNILMSGGVLNMLAASNVAVVANSGNGHIALKLANVANAVDFGPGSLTIADSGGAQLTLNDTVLLRDGAADTLAMRRSTNAQTFRVYNTYTDAANNEYARILWSGNTLYFGAASAGTGLLRPINVNGYQIQFSSGNVARWDINNSGHFLAETDNTYDIGASGANRPRTVYAATGVSGGTYVQAGNYFGFTSLGAIYGISDGVFRLQDNAGTSFGRLQFGGTTASFPALKRSGIELQARLADDSGPAVLTTGTLKTGVFTTTTNYTAAVTDRTILANGSTLTITLPTAVGASGQEYVVKVIANSTATVATTSSQNIDGATTYSLSAQYKFVRVQSDGTQWWIIGNN